MDRKSVDIFSKLNGRKRDDLKASRRERPHKTTVRLTLGFVIRRRAHLLMKRVYTACVCLYILCFTMETFESKKEGKRREKWKAKERESSIDQSRAYIFSAAAVLLFGLEFNKPSVFFVRWFRTPFFEQVVYALGVLVIPSGSDVSPVVQRHFRLFD